jgi:FKBP-type peptidyl-prolyl cis-trans isomerase
VLAAVLAASIACILPACDSGARSSAATAGATATEGSYVALHYDARVTAVGGAPRSDPTFDSTRRGEPFLAKLGKTPLLPGLLEGLLGMKEGERRRITIPPEKGYGALGKPPVPPDATLEYEVELVDVFTRLPSGLQVRVVTDGTGAVPAKGDRVIVNHRGWLLETGREVTSSRMTGRSLEFELGQGLAIAGLEEALLQMKAGSRWIVAIPPELAYGEMGRFPLLLPGNEVLFDVELLGTRPR